MPIGDIRGQPLCSQYMGDVSISSLLNWSGRVGSTLLKRLTSGREVPYCRICDFLSASGSELILQEVLSRRGDFRARGINASGSPAFYRMKTPLNPSPEFLG